MRLFIGGVLVGLGAYLYGEGCYNLGKMKGRKVQAEEDLELWRKLAEDVRKKCEEIKAKEGSN